MNAVGKERRQMLVAQRTDTLRPGKTPAYLSAYRQLGLGALQRTLGRPLAIFTSEIGNLNEVISLFRISDSSEWEISSRSLRIDPDVRHFEMSTKEFVVDRTTQLLTLPSFASLKFDLLTRPSSPATAFVEKRIYTLSPGTLPLFMAAYGPSTYHAISALRRVLGVFVTQHGNQDQFVAFGAYGSLEQRALQRRDQYNSPIFQAYAETARPLIARQQNQLLLPICFE